MSILFPISVIAVTGWIFISKSLKPTTRQMATVQQMECPSCKMLAKLDEDESVEVTEPVLVAMMKTFALQAIGAREHLDPNIDGGALKLWEKIHDAACDLEAGLDWGEEGEQAIAAALLAGNEKSE